MKRIPASFFAHHQRVEKRLEVACAVLDCIYEIALREYRSRAELESALLEITGLIESSDVDDFSLNTGE
jgi:hypothetical protein